MRACENCGAPLKDDQARACSLRCASLLGASARQPPRDVVERFWEKVRTGEGCWQWTGSTYGQHGYGAFRIGARQMRAHRVAWQLTHGEAPRGFVLHSCHNRGCVRPDHLRVGTHLENMADMRLAGRAARPRGEANAMAKVSAATALAIREAYAAPGETNESVARRFDVTPSLVGMITRGALWSQVGGPVAPSGVCRHCGTTLATRSSHESRCATATSEERAFFAANRRWPPDSFRSKKCAQCGDILAMGRWRLCGREECRRKADAAHHRAKRRLAAAARAVTP